MIKVIDVAFKEKGKPYMFSINDLELKKNITVIVKTERGLQFGKTVSDIYEVDEKKISSEIKPVMRIASKKDYDQNIKNIKEAKEAIVKCRELVEKEGLKMQIIDANYTFDKDQLVFRFLADNRVDFRNLAKELASIYKTRIELRQIGPRDKAKEVGGLGPCGRPLCCSSYLYTFDNITINMAKNQNIALNPNKINGACGRLLCCLSYEDDTYSELKKDLPKVGDIINKDGISGKVISVDVIKKTYRIETKDKEIIELS